MHLNCAAIARALGMLTIVIGLSMIPSLITAAIYNENEVLIAFILAIAPAVIVGMLIVIFVKPSSNRLMMRDGFIIVSFSWILASLIGAIPFFASGAIPSFIDAIFETVSGFTTTGASILTDVEAMPKGLLFWRSFTHWLGGMGILIFAIALLPALGIGGHFIAKAETPGPTLDKLTPKMSDTAKRLYLIYTCMTLAQILLLKLAGMNWFDSFTHTFGSVGTGGFSTYNNSVAHFNSATIDIIIAVFMILAGVNFNLYYMGIVRDVKTLFKNAELRLYLTIIGVSTLLISINLYTSGTFESIGNSLRHGVFQTATIITTTGYASCDYDLWPTFSRMILLILMFVGGCSASTGGGIKVIRVLIVMKLIKRGITLRVHPNAVVSVKLGEKPIQSDLIQYITSFVFLYITTAFLSTIIVSIDNYDFMTSLSAVLACLGNIGPGFNLVGPSMNFSIFSDPIKLLLSLLMLAGRLELFTMFMLFSPRFWNPDR